jgi:hypothetical protein
MALSAPDFVSIVLEQEVASALVPPRRIAVALGLTPAGGGRVLVIGGPLRWVDRSELVRHGCRVDVVHTLEAAVEAMDRERYRVVVTSAHVSGEADGLRFVRGLKHAKSTAEVERARLVRLYAGVPFLVLPLEGNGEYAVFRTLESWYLGQTREVPIAQAVLRLSSVV